MSKLHQPTKQGTGQRMASVARDGDAFPDSCTLFRHQTSNQERRGVKGCAGSPGSHNNVSRAMRPTRLRSWSATSLRFAERPRTPPTFWCPPTSLAFPALPDMVSGGNWSRNPWTMCYVPSGRHACEVGVHTSLRFATWRQTPQTFRCFLRHCASQLRFWRSLERQPMDNVCYATPATRLRS